MPYMLCLKDKLKRFELWKITYGQDLDNMFVVDATVYPDRRSRRLQPYMAPVLDWKSRPHPNRRIASFILVSAHAGHVLRGHAESLG